MTEAMKDRKVTRTMPGGATPERVRNYNERLVLSTIQSHGPMASADIARFTSLSAQTASVITRSLEADGLLRRGKPVRGKVGKPLTPMTLNHDGVLSVGLRIGRRSADMILIDFSGRIRGHLTTTFPFPTPSRITRFASDGFERLMNQLSADQAAKVVGIGIAAPFELWNWLDLVNAPKDEMSAWRGFDFKAAFARFTDLPVTIGNDVTLACFGEHVFGAAQGAPNLAYFYIGSFAGGGIVLNGRVLTGPSGNAGAFGTIPVRETTRPDHQLIHNASIYILEKRLEEAGIDPSILWSKDRPWEGFDAILDTWLTESASHLATACVSVTAILDVPAIVMDGGFPPDVRTRLTDAVAANIARVDTRGITLPRIIPGQLGHMAGALGSAFQPIVSEYLIDGSIFVQTG